MSERQIAQLNGIDCVWLSLAFTFVLWMQFFHFSVFIYMMKTHFSICANAGNFQGSICIQDVPPQWRVNHCSLAWTGPLGTADTGQSMW